MNAASLAVFDPSVHATSKARCGFSFKPRQCAECRMLFIPKSAEQAVCKTCAGETFNNYPKGDEMNVVKSKVCARCGKEYSPTSNVQKYCADCMPKATKEYNKNFRRKRAAGLSERTPKDINFRIKESKTNSSGKSHAVRDDVTLFGMITALVSGGLTDSITMRLVAAPSVEIVVRRTA